MNKIICIPLKPEIFPEIAISVDESALVSGELCTCEVGRSRSAVQREIQEFKHKLENGGFHCLYCPRRLNAQDSVYNQDC